MNGPWNLLLVLLALVLFLVAAAIAHLGPEPPYWYRRFLALGLAFWVASQLFGK